MKKKKEVFDMTKRGKDFKLIVLKEENGEIHSIMEKPNTKTWSDEDLSIYASGAHVFQFNPEQNHCDFYLSGSLTHKEYSERNYGYELSGGLIII